MKIKIQSSKGKRRTTSKAADEELSTDNTSMNDRDIHIWAESSSGSVASSVTAPPSQTASFYKRVLKQEYHFDEDTSRVSNDDYDDLDDMMSVQSGDEDQSFAESRSRTGSEDAGDGITPDVAVKKKKKKKKKTTKSGLFRARREKLLGGTIEEGQDEDENVTIARRSRPGGDDGSVASARPKRRTSLGSLFAGKDTAVKSYSANRSIDYGDLGYGKAEPDQDRDQEKDQEKPKRRGSLGAMFARRVSLSTSKAQVDEPAPQSRRRRHSLLGSASEHVPSSVPISADLAGLSLHDRPKSSIPTNTRAINKSQSQNNFVTSLKDKDMYWLMNQERMARRMPPFTRSILLETLAKSMAIDISSNTPPAPTQYYGNVGCGKSLEHIHKTIMSDLKGLSRKNILSETFTECGVGEATGPDRKIYTVALFE